MDSMRVPFRFRGGQVEKVADGTDEYYAYLLATTAQIIPGELPLTPQYGVADPTFSEEGKRQLAFAAGAFIPEINLESVEIIDRDSGVSQINISFSRRT